MNKKMLVLAKWLKSYESAHFTDGTLERTIAQTKDDTMHEIGDLILEINDLTNKQINDELITL